MRTSGRGGLFAALLMFAGVLWPILIALTVRWYLLAARRLEGQSQVGPSFDS
jgi:hypothetical protein